MEKYPKISIITPSYNQGQYIEQTICSVLDQKYPNLEYIIIDGGSTDNTVEIIKKYEKHLKYWVSEKDRGQSHAINKGLEHCTGDIFNWINSDDYYLPNALFKIAEIFVNNTHANLVVAKEILFSHTEQKLSEGTFVDKDLATTLFRSLYDQPCTFIRLTTLKGLFPVREEFHYVMDAELYVRYLLQYGLDGIVCSDEVITMFRLHENSKGVSQNSRFDIEKYIFESALMKCFGLSKNLQKYALGQGGHYINLEYSTSQKIDKKMYERLFCEREISRLSSKRLPVKFRFIFLPFFFKYHPYKGVRFWKCFLADYLFPELYGRFLKYRLRNY